MDENTVVDEAWRSTTRDHRPDTRRESFVQSVKFFTTLQSHGEFYDRAIYMDSRQIQASRVQFFTTRDTRSERRWRHGADFAIR